MWDIKLSKDLIRMWIMDSRLLFSIIVLLGFVFLFSKIYEANKDISNRLGAYIKIRIMKQSSSIRKLDVKRNIDFQKEYIIDKLHFPLRDRLTYGDIILDGLKDDFFIEAEGSFVTKKDGDFIFTVGSDDGFRLFIDNQKIMEFIEIRPFNKNSKKVFLKAGLHKLHLIYFQAYGQIGLKCEYQKSGDYKTYIYGESTDDMNFVRIP